MDTLSPAARPFPEVRSSPLATLRALKAIVVNPLDALPPGVTTEPYVFSRLAGRLRVHLCDPALIHEVLVRHADGLDKGEEVRRSLGPALGQGLLTADGAHWRWQRQSVAGAFRHERLRALVPAMLAAAGRTRERWEGLPAGPVDVGHEMMRTTFDIIVETMMSGGRDIDVARVERGISDYLAPSGWTFALAVTGAPDWVPHPGKAKSRRAIRFLHESLAHVVAERRARPDGPDDLVAALLAAADPETGRRMSDREVVDNLMTFVTAGHETTALGLAWTFHLLAGHPDVEARMLAEIEAATGGGAVAPDHVDRLAYTRQVFHEAMRLYPPAPIITRTALRDVPMGDRTIPKGTVIYVPIYALHRHEALWPDPERFDPERFAPEAVKGRHRFSTMPFGAGPRVCIGNVFAVLEAVAILAVLLPRFRLARLPGRTPEPVAKVTLRPRRPLRMALAPRT